MREGGFEKQASEAAQEQGPRARSSEYANMLAELERVIEASEEEQHKFIEKRLADLSQNVETGEISYIGRNIYRGFLGPKMEIRRNMMVDPFVLDDPDLYADLFETMRRFKETAGWEEKQLREIMPNAIQWTLSKYFGNIAASAETEMQNREFYFNHTAAESPAISIKELKGKGFAVCAEKAAAAQNLLSFVGLESELIAASGCRIPAEAEEGAHYFILLHGPKGDMIYDPTNPRLLFDKEGKLRSYGPAMYSVSEEQTQRLTAGESITVAHSDDKMNEEGQRMSDKSNRLYNGPQKH